MKIYFSAKFLRKLKLILIWLFIPAYGAHADDGSVAINFHGEIISNACEVNMPSSQDVPLGDVATTELMGPGSLSKNQEFSITIDCPDSGPETAALKFNGASASDPTLLALDNEPNGASGVAVRINESDGKTKINLNTDSVAQPLQAGVNTLNFTAQYETLVSRSEVAPGTANATAQFTIIYP